MDETTQAGECDFERGSPPWYEWAYASLDFDAGFEDEIQAAADRVLAGKDRYLWVQGELGIPWRVVGCLHNMEADCNFRACLHNGEMIIGTSRKTTLVPRGRGPFATWEVAALDALRLDGLSFTRWNAWTLGLELQKAEAFNGMGYMNYHPETTSPYVWGCTSMNPGQGKYVRDGVYDAHADTHGQVGVAAIYKRLDHMW